MEDDVEVHEAAMKPCKDCGQHDPVLLYKSGRMDRCYDCQNFANLRGKATGGGVQVTHEQFLEWKSMEGNRTCAYCGIDSAKLYALNVVNPRNRKRFEAVGVDRKDNARPYTLDNITPCCALCNTIKSGLLTHEEMTLLGPTLRGFWDARIRA